MITHVGDSDPVTHDVEAWDDVLRLVPTWMLEVDEFVTTPDLWAQLRNEAEVVEAVAGPELENAPFTNSERSEVLRRLQEVRRYIEAPRRQRRSRFRRRPRLR